MFAQLRAAGAMFVWLTLLTGVLYPVLVWAIGQMAFRDQANGSVLVVNGRPTGSALIGQQFDQPRYFWGRASATDPPYNSGASTGSNLGPTNPALLTAVKDRVETIRKSHPEQSGPVPADLVTTSGSGLDPHISPAAAEYQIARVAKIRGIDEAAVRELVQKYTEPPTLGILGEPRVNVLKLNLALDGAR